MVEGADGTRAAGFCIKAPDTPSGEPVRATPGGEKAPTYQSAPTANPEQEKQIQRQEQPSAQQPQPATASDQQGTSLQPADRNTMLQVQRSLSGRGYKVTEDSLGGPATVAAVRDFQEKNGLKATGELDPATLRALGIRPGVSAK